MQPVILLVRPQLVENIGTTARAMLNCGLEQLRLVAPRDPWPLDNTHQARMLAAASGADAVLEQASVFPSLAEAIGDLHTLYAATARPRDMLKPVLTPRLAMVEVRQRLAAGEKIGFLFGPERTGLTNDDLSVVEKIITIPANPAFSSFNLAQAVLVLAYEWCSQQQEAHPETLAYGKTRPATKAELQHFFDHLERELEAHGFFTTPELKPSMVQNLRNALLRGQWSEQEVRTWHGVVTALARNAR